MAKKKKNLKKAKEKIEKPFRFILPEEIKRWIFGIGMFLIATIITLAFFERAGMAGRIFMSVFIFLIGKAVFALPLIFILGGLAFFLQRSKNKWLIGLAIFIFVFGISGILGSFSPEAKQGGWIGYFITSLVFKVFGEIVTKIIFGSIIFIGGVIFFYFLHQPREKPVVIIEEKRSPLIKKILNQNLK